MSHETESKPREERNEGHDSGWEACLQLWTASGGTAVVLLALDVVLSKTSSVCVSN